MDIPREDEEKRRWIIEAWLPYHERQLREPYRSTVHLERFIRRLMPDAEGEAVDVGCGVGVNMAYLARAFPGLRWTGVDLGGELLFPQARALFARYGVWGELIQGDFFDLERVVGGRRFQLVLCSQTLLSLSSYDPLMEQLLRVADGWVVVSSLFTDFEVDATIQVLDYTRSGDAVGPYFYNVYCLRRFRERCLALGATDVVSEDFEIDIDLPRIPGGMRTYTEQLADGRRLQLSGPLHMPWKFVAARRQGAEAR